MSAPSNYHQTWMDPENVGGTTYFYSHLDQHTDGSGTLPVTEDEQNFSEVVPGVGSMEDPAGVSGPLMFPSYSMFNGQPAPELKNHAGLGGGEPVGNGASSFGDEPNAGADPASRILNLEPPSQNLIIVHPPPLHQNPTSYFVPDELKLELMHRNAVLLSQPNPNIFPDLPAQIDHYHQLCPLEDTTHHGPQNSTSLTFPSTVYKAVNSKNGFTYCLRRMHGYQLPSGKWLGIIKTWKQLTHCNLIQLREVFTTTAFGDNSMIFAYDYFPTADTLTARHFQQNKVNGNSDPFSSGDPFVPRPYSYQRNCLLQHQTKLLPENLIWAYIVQLTSVIHTIHTAGLSVRSLDPSKVLITSRTRPSIRLNCCGIHEVITFDPNANHAIITQFYQQGDLVAFGKLILALACNSMLAVEGENLKLSVDFVALSYSAQLRNLIVHLMSPQRSINDVMQMTCATFYKQLDSANARAEQLEHYLAKELENGRLFRLVVKLNTIVERQELNQDPQWSETGDRYLLKLFRDYVFHQITPDGRPWLEMSHVINTLNRLDAGTAEKITLVSRDEQNVLITSYEELKQCMEQSFREILSSSTVESAEVAAASAAISSLTSQEVLLSSQQQQSVASAAIAAAAAFTMSPPRH